MTENPSDVVEVPESQTPAADAVAAAQNEQAKTIQETEIEIPNMDPEAALQMSRKAMSTVQEEAGVEMPFLNPGINSVEGKGISMDLDTRGEGEQAVMVMHITYVQVNTSFIAFLIEMLLQMAALAPRGSQAHQRLKEEAVGRPHDDGLPDQETLDDVEVEKMGGKPDPEKEAEAAQQSEKAYDISSLPPYHRR